MGVFDVCRDDFPGAYFLALLQRYSFTIPSSRPTKPIQYEVNMKWHREPPPVTHFCYTTVTALQPPCYSPVSPHSQVTQISDTYKKTLTRALPL